MQGVPGVRATVTGVVPTATPLISTAAPLGSDVMVSWSLGSGSGGWGVIGSVTVCCEEAEAGLGVGGVASG